VCIKINVGEQNEFKLMVSFNDSFNFYGGVVIS
jgi:hypothetical protein